MQRVGGSNPRWPNPTGTALPVPSICGRLFGGETGLEERYWCVTCRRSWPTALWLANGWICPSGEGRHPHIPYSSVVKVLGREPEERQGQPETGA